MLSLALSLSIMLSSISSSFGEEKGEPGSMAGEAAAAEPRQGQGEASGAGMDGEEGEAGGRKPLDGSGASRRFELSYNTWELDALYNWAKESNRTFRPEDLLRLPYEAEEAKAAFYAKYGGGQWLLLDVFPSNPDSQLSGEFQSALPGPGDSAAYLTANSSTGEYSLIAICRNGQSFAVHIESHPAGELIGVSVVEIEENPLFAAGKSAPAESAPAEGAEEPSEAEESARSEDPAPQPQEEEPAPESAEEPSISPPQEPAEEEPPEGLPEAQEDLEKELESEEPEPISSDELPLIPEEGLMPPPSAEAAPGGEAAQEEAPPASEPEESTQPQAEYSEAPFSADEPPPEAAPALEPETGESSVMDEAARPSSEAAADPLPPQQPEPSESGGPLDALISAALSLLSVNAYGAELEDLAASPSALDATDSGGGEPAGLALDEAAEPILEAAPYEPMQGSFVDFELDGAASIAAIVISEGRLLRAASETRPTPTNPSSFADDIVYFPVSFYDYEGTMSAGGYPKADSQGRYGRDVFPYSMGYYNFNTPEGYAVYNPASGKYEYRGNPLSSYFLFNSLNMPRFPDMINQSPSNTSPENVLAKQNVDFKLENDAVHYGDGITLGIAKETLDSNGFQLNFRTMNNLKLFPAIGNSTASEVFIYGADNSEHALGAQSDDGVQSTTPALGQSMITAYPDYQFPFLFDNDGYYTFDSDVNHVHLDKAPAAEKKLALHAGSQLAPAANLKGFFPLNTADGVADANNLNYNFGMKMEREFMLPQKDAGGNYPVGQVTKPNNSKEDMIFEFSGDDDLWVYIDGKLALDLGGTHRKAYGKINFTTGDISIGYEVAAADEGQAKADVAAIYQINDCDDGTATTNPSALGGMTATDKGDGKYLVTYTVGYLYSQAEFTASGRTGEPGMMGYLNIDTDPNAVHKFSLFYVERSPYESNCAMRFNIPMSLFLIKEAYGFDDEDAFSFEVTVREKINHNNSITITPQPDITSGALKRLDIPSNEYPVGTVLEVQVKEIGITPEPETDFKYITEFRSTHSAETSRTLSTSEDFPESPWYEFTYGQTGVILCLNYKVEPLTIKKFEYERPSSAIPNVTFELYKDEVKFGGDITTNADGEIALNDDLILEPNTVYTLREKRNSYTKQYEPLSDITFKTTGGLSPKIEYVEQNGEKLAYSADDYDTLNEINEEGDLLFSYATVNGENIHIYDKKIKGGITVEKIVDGYEAGDHPKGDPIFLFKIEKKAALDGQVITSWVESIQFDSSYANETKTAVFDSLEPGFYYTVSELNSMRYDLQGVAVSGDGYSDEDDEASTATILLGRLVGDEYVPASLNSAKVTFTNIKNYDEYLSDAVAAVNRLHIANDIEPEAPKVVTVNFLDANDGNAKKASISAIAGDRVVVPGGIGQMMDRPVLAVGTPSAEGEVYRPLEPIEISGDGPVSIYYNRPKDSGSGEGGGGSSLDEVIAVYIYDAVKQVGSTLEMAGHVEYVRPGEAITLPAGAVNPKLLPAGAPKPAMMEPGADLQGTVQMVDGNGDNTVDYDEYLAGSSNIENTIIYQDLLAEPKSDSRIIIYRSPPPEQITVHVYRIVEQLTGSGLDNQVRNDGSLDNQIRLVREDFILNEYAGFTLPNAEMTFVTPKNATLLWLDEDGVGFGSNYVADSMGGWLEMQVGSNKPTIFDFYARNYYGGLQSEISGSVSMSYWELAGYANSNDEIIMFTKNLTFQAVNFNKTNTVQGNGENGGNANDVNLLRENITLTRYCDDSISFYRAGTNLWGIYLLHESDRATMESRNFDGGGWSGNNNWIWYKGGGLSTDSFHAWMIEWYSGNFDYEPYSTSIITVPVDHSNPPFIINRYIE
jgi:hypothetical protein